MTRRINQTLKWPRPTNATVPFKVIIGEGVVLQHRRVVGGQIKKRRTLALGQYRSSWHGSVLKMVLIILRQRII